MGQGDRKRKERAQREEPRTKRSRNWVAKWLGLYRNQRSGGRGGKGEGLERFRMGGKEETSGQCLLGHVK